jgi:hypothetical protein
MFSEFPSHRCKGQSRGRRLDWLAALQAVRRLTGEDTRLTLGLLLRTRAARNILDGKNLDTVGNFLTEKTNFSSVMRTLKNTADVDGRTEMSCRLQANQNSSYIRFWHASLVRHSKSAVLLDCDARGPVAGDPRLGSHSLHRQKRRGAWFRRFRHDQPTRDRIHQWFSFGKDAMI